MERVNRIWNHPVYQESLAQIVERETDRKYCGHTAAHFLDVARLACLLAQDEGIPVERELVYAAALLHDIGRCREYQDGTPHDKASLAIAGTILPSCGFSETECQIITGMIASHRQPSQERGLNRVFYRADKLSRNCFACAAREECDWPAELKNLSIKY